MKRIIFFVLLWALISQNNSIAQQDFSPAKEGGMGFNHTFAASTYGKGYLGININNIYTYRSVKGTDTNEHLLVGAAAFTYDVSDDIEFSAVLFAIGQGILSSSTFKNDNLSSGFGYSALSAKLKLPIDAEQVDIGLRTSVHFPMGATFGAYPTYPYDSDVYELDLLGLQTLKVSPNLNLHLNEGYRFRGLRSDYVGEKDVLLINLAADYKVKANWRGYSEVSSSIELDDKIEPIRDRLLFTQGIQYLTSNNIGLSLSANFRLNKSRKDNTPTRAENWRVLFGISFSSRTYQPDNDQDGIPNSKDVEPNTPSGWPVGSNGKALDSDNDGVPDGNDQEPNTRSGATTDRFGKSLDTDNDGVPDGIDVEPNTVQGAIVNVKGVAIDSDGDGVPDGIDEEQTTPKGLMVDIKGRALPPMELELLSKGLLRVNKIYFDVGRATIKPESFSILNEIAKILERHPDLQIQINGHTDATGTDELNMKLSTDRAQSVKTFLISRAGELNENNLTVKGFGKTKPISDDRTDEGRTLNRRVEFQVMNIDLLKDIKK